MDDVKRSRRAQMMQYMSLLVYDFDSKHSVHSIHTKNNNKATTRMSAPLLYPLLSPDHSRGTTA